MGWLGREARGLWRSVHYDVTRPAPLSKRRTEVLHPEYDAYQRPPRRRYLAAGGLGLVVAVFVAGVYLAVATGLGGVLSSNAASVPPPESTPAPASSSPTVVSEQPPRPVARTAPASRRPAAVPGTPVPVAAVPSCLCPLPPVPTPEASSVSPSHSPSPSPSPSVSPSASPSPSRTGSGQQ